MCLSAGVKECVCVCVRTSVSVLESVSVSMCVCVLLIVSVPVCGYVSLSHGVSWRDILSDVVCV